MGFRKGKDPQGWTDGFDTGAVERDELYVVGALPVMYLLDAEGRVWCSKEPAVATVLSRYSNGIEIEQARGGARGGRVEPAVEVETCECFGGWSRGR